MVRGFFFRKIDTVTSLGNTAVIILFGREFVYLVPLRSLSNGLQQPGVSGRRRAASTYRRQGGYPDQLGLIVF